MKKYYPDGDLNDANNVYGYTRRRRRMVAGAQACGDNLTRENIMKAAANLDLHAADAAARHQRQDQPDDFFPIERQQLQRFDGKQLGAVRQDLRAAEPGCVFRNQEKAASAAFFVVRAR